MLQTAVLLCLLAMFGQQTSNDALDPAKLKITWRLQYGVSVLLLAGLVMYRVKYTRESSTWATAARARRHGSIAGGGSRFECSALASEEHFKSATATAPLVSADSESADTDCCRADNGTSCGVQNVSLSTLTMLRLLAVDKWDRLLGGGLGWFVWDVTFYGKWHWQ